ncbi:tRNA epoxyqueuosine(34) reductase QueG [Marinigracilibium pacificum]|uniref:Epoxyqueuosine reductase n=1 Tax=Marinigracilibium pacificum TaxID=2729599 RepID=A0A848J1Z1_9BACT|nr:tRNA epoxyqueuosine(34) reductase QueG [Marinigracilibium pacificum]NMM49741.1 tRNA epoxyqueuosine(34) reductase QueG [Marinigracilibium pacificum]
MKSDLSVANNTAIVKKLASDYGFSFCGISKAEFLESEAGKLEEWLKRGFQGKMSYLENHFDKRLDPTKLVPGAKSVVSLIYNYFPPEDENQRPDSYKIARYAYGKDYHFIIKDKLKLFFEELSEAIGEIDGRAFVDSAPVMERSWAEKSGIGWIGKNSLLLNRSLGSYFFLAELIIDLELTPDGPIKNYCGTCTACMEACPTDAIPESGVVDGSRCISYLTIELKDDIPDEFSGKMNDWMFGCDICQEVCPWNRFAQPHKEESFIPNEFIKNASKKEWEEITQDIFSEVFRKSAVKRTKYSGLKRNIEFIKKEKNKAT